MRSTNGLRCAVSLYVFAAVCTRGALDDIGIGAQAPQTTSVTREDIFVPHVSTVPATAGQSVRIAVRRISRTGTAPTRGAVLFANPGSVIVPMFTSDKSDPSLTVCEPTTVKVGATFSTVTEKLCVWTPPSSSVSVTVTVYVPSSA